MAEADTVDEHLLGAYETLIQRRLSGEPVARILGSQEFYGLSFALNAATLVPRPETEMLVDFGLGALKDKPAPHILDLGTGTGCILVALLANLPAAQGLGVDLSAQALAQAQFNADINGVGNRTRFVEGAWYAPLDSDQRFDLIVSNPPYIVSEVIAGLAREVRNFDPALALDGGADGLDAYRTIIADAPNRLVPDGHIALEIGYDQGVAVAQLLESVGFVAVAVEKDLSGHDRMVTGRR